MAATEVNHKPLRNAALRTVFLLLLTMLAACSKPHSNTDMLSESGAPERTPQATSEEPVESVESDAIEIPGMPLSFMFASGAGAWSTRVTIQTDGSFSGRYGGSDRGDTGDGYPNGTRYESVFNGKFSEVTKINELEYSLKIVSLESEGTVGTEKTVDGVKVITSDPYGFDNADVFLLYLPGRPMDDLPQEFIDWVRTPMAWNEIPETLPFYGLYNVGGQEGFFLDTAITKSPQSSEPPVSEIPLESFAERSKAERKALHTFFSNFSESGMRNFESADYSDAELIEFSIWHTYRNNGNLISYSANDARGKISADTIADTVERYFGIRINNQSADDADHSDSWHYGEDAYEYRNGFYYFTPADGDPLKWSQVTSMSSNENGTFSVNIDVYEAQEWPDNIYDDIEDWHLADGMEITRKGKGQGDVWGGPCYSYSASAVIEPYTYGGKSTYKLISLKAR